MAKADSSEQNDADILERHEDVFRARDVIPPYDEKLRRGPGPQRTAGDASALDETVKDSEQTQEQRRIPTFDLAKEIMAEHRRTTAANRASPLKKGQMRDKEPALEVSVKTLSQAGSQPPQQQRIITEIVARDIEKLCAKSSTK